MRLSTSQLITYANINDPFSGDLTVNILDVNDNAPYFVDVDQVSFNVTENMPKTSTIGRAILARDVDEDNVISYSLTG